MQQPNGFLSRLTDKEHKSITTASTIIAMVVDAAVLFSCSWRVGLSCTPYWPVALIGLFYIPLLYSFLLPLARKHSWVYWAVAIVNAAGTATLARATNGAGEIVGALLVVAVVTVSVILSGRWPTYLYLATALTVYFFISGADFDKSIVNRAMLSSLVIIGVMVTETVMSLGKITNQQITRMEMINRIAHQIATTIEPNEVISIVNTAIRDTLMADTYYVGILRNEKLRLEVFYDDGEFFPPRELSIEGSLSGWVITNKKSILLRNVPVEAEKLGLPIHIVGKNRLSLSWMGVPLEAGAHVLGIMAMASYRMNHFNLADLRLLESVAQQTALAMDNAYHHAEVEEQSRRDSLTQAYNHGYFLSMVREFVDYARENRTSVGLIMLDIDFFKMYNDRYGHQVGDQVLICLAETIKAAIRSTDMVGRWGGEEFAVLLFDAAGKDAAMIAERVRQTLQTLQIKTPGGKVVPAPTVSLGIAILPQETDNLEALIHLADQRLYAAKARGRNQIEPSEEYWK